MLYTKLNYYTHLLLNSKYRMFINLFIILMIYFLIYGNKVIYCMNDNPENSLAPKPFNFNSSKPGSSFVWGSTTGSAKSAAPFSFGGGASCGISTLPTPAQEAPIIQEVPAVAEAKEVHRPSHQVLALKREILDYAGAQAQALFLERMRVEEEIIALTTKDPEEVLQALEQKKQNAIRIYNSLGNKGPRGPYATIEDVPMNLEQIESYAGEKRLLSNALRDPRGLVASSSSEKLDRIYYLIRMYRRLRDIS